RFVQTATEAGPGLVARDIIGHGLEQVAADAFGHRKPASAGRAEGKMRCNGKAPPLGKTPGGVGDEQVVADVMMNGHETSPEPPIAARNLSKASRMRDLTVPKGMFNRVAMALCDWSSKKDRRSRAACSSGKA